MQLRPLSATDYIRDVLPHSSRLWAGSRSFEEYVDEFRALTESPFGRRFRTVGFYVDGALVASCKRYARELRCGTHVFKAAGIGAVFTPEPLRGRGYATALLGALLDHERAAGTDCAYLFSDIGAAFYEHIGFAALPSRAFSVRADRLGTEKVALVTAGRAESSAIQRVFAAFEARRPFAFRRTALDWEWQRLRGASKEQPAAPFTLAVRRGRAIAAYVTGRRLPAADAFVLDEFAFASDADAEAIAPLLRAAAGDLKTIRGWLPPAPARDALPRGAVRRRSDAIAMLVPLSAAMRAAWSASGDALRRADADPCWSTDHI